MATDEDALTRRAIDKDRAWARGEHGSRPLVLAFPPMIDTTKLVDARFRDQFPSGYPIASTTAAGPAIARLLSQVDRETSSASMSRGACRTTL